jgi:hypothetical protein
LLFLLPGLSPSPEILACCSAPGYSGSAIAISRSATAEWLFQQEKATLQDAGKGT